MSFDFNCSTSATDGFGNRGSASQSEFYWVPQPKHCGGVTECGLVCHKGINCTIVDKQEKDGKTTYKYYCRKCKEFGEGETGDCK